MNEFFVILFSNYFRFASLRPMHSRKIYLKIEIIFNVSIYSNTMVTFIIYLFYFIQKNSIIEVNSASF